MIPLRQSNMLLMEVQVDFQVLQTPTMRLVVGK